MSKPLDATRLDNRDRELIAEVIGYCTGLAAGLEMSRGLRIESTTTPSAEGYPKLLAARLRDLSKRAWPRA